MKLVCCFVLFLYCESNAFEIPEDMTYLVETLNPSVDKEGNKIFEGDMVLSKEQEEIIKTGDRAAQHNLATPWPNKTFHYRISPALANLQTIATAIRNWQDNTCIRFNLARPNAPAFAQFERLEEGCFAAVGYYGNQQTINLGSRCERLGTVEHEIGHALGLIHEQSRPDRDQFVTVFDGNMKAGADSEFEIVRNANTYGISYDLDSIMHYGPLGFSANGRNTMATKNPFDHFRIGEREGMSFDDKKLVNLMYRCSENCPNPPNCRNGGFVNERCSCVCPAGTRGTNCQTGRRTFTTLDCGSEMNQAGNISSPGFPNAEGVKITSKCVWRITAPQRQKVRISFHNFSLHPRLSPNHPNFPNWCFHDYLDVRAHSQIQGNKYCEEELNNKMLTSSGNILVLVFERVSNWDGFQAEVEFVN